MLKRATLVLAVTVALLGVTAVPVQAAYTDCSAGNFCLWTSSNFTGTRVTINSTIHTCTNLSGSVDNNASSAYNHAAIGGPQMLVWQGYNCTGTKITLNPGQVMSSFSASFNNTASSVSHRE